MPRPGNQKPLAIKGRGVARGATFVPACCRADTLSAAARNACEGPGCDNGATPPEATLPKGVSPPGLPGPFACRAAAGLTPCPGSLKARMAGYFSRSTPLAVFSCHRKSSAGGGRCQRFVLGLAAAQGKRPTVPAEGTPRPHPTFAARRSPLYPCPAGRAVCERLGRLRGWCSNGASDTGGCSPP